MWSFCFNNAGSSKRTASVLHGDRTLLALHQQQPRTCRRSWWRHSGRLYIFLNFILNCCNAPFIAFFGGDTGVESCFSRDWQKFFDCCNSNTVVIRNTRAMLLLVVGSVTYSCLVLRQSHHPSLRMSFTSSLKLVYFTNPFRRTLVYVSRRLQSINLYLKSGKSPYTNTHTHACTKHNHNIQ